MYSARGLSARFVHTFGAIALVSGAVSIALFITSTVPAYAVPAAPAVVTLTQPDGRTIQARLYGDEWQHYTRTLDGRIIEQNAQGEWVTVGSGKPMPSPKSRERAAVADSPQVVPPFGTANVPVLCINFSDTSTQFATGDFDTLLFNGSSSMTAFYTENSYGQFTVAAGPSGIGGWYTASDTHDHYGTNGAGFDDFPAELVIEAVEAADAAGFDFGPYDSDGDGNVDVVAIIHQGTDEAAGGPSTDIWSHRSSLTSRQFFANDGTGPVTTGSGKVVDDYIIMPEHDPGDNLATIGVFAHEYGHALGLPDFYDRDSSSNGLGSWSLMAAGAWNGNAGDTPAHFDAWCKVQLGWVTPVVATSSILNAPLPEVETNQVIYQVFAPGSTTEYFLVENRQLTGFDSALPASGALIYHVDDTQALSQNDNEWRPGLTGSGNYQCAIEQADGMWQLERFRFDTPPGNNGDAGDPYPGTSGNRAYDDVSTPSATLYDGSDFPLVVRNISPSSAAMTIDIVDTMVPLVPRSIMASDTLGDEGGSITVTWSRSGDDGRGADDVAEYDVMRSLADTGPFAVIDTVPAGTTAVFDTNVVDGPPGYYYKVVTRDTSGLTSETKVVGPATSRDDLKPPAVDMLLVKDSQADNGRSMTLTWAGYQAPADLVSFRVYRSTAPFTDVNATDVDRIATVTELGDDEAPSVAITDPAARSYIDKIGRAHV